MQAKQMAKMVADAKTNQAAGDAFFAKNAKAPGVQTTASGLQYQVITQGTGAKPTVTDTVRVQYKGTLLDGKTFDSSYVRGEPASFPGALRPNVAANAPSDQTQSSLITARSRPWVGIPFNRRR